MRIRGTAVLATALAVGFLWALALQPANAENAASPANAAGSPNPAGPSSPPVPPKPGVKIQFLPPPMEGTISLGIFDSTGKLVRTLHKEEEIQSEAFIKDINGLITFWDGKDDAGNLLPPGTYCARGFLVGDLKVEGEAFHCNDWVADEASPRIRRITKIGPMLWGAPNGFNRPTVEAVPVGKLEDRVVLTVELADASTAHPECVASGTLYPPSSRDSSSMGPPGLDVLAKLYPVLGTLIAAAIGREETLWVITRAADGSHEVNQYSKNKEFLRRLAIDPTQPQPTQIAASQAKETNDAICLLEENAKGQRFRWLELSQSEADPANPVAAAVSTWKELLCKTITFNDQFAQVQPELKMPGGKPLNSNPESQQRLRIGLMANPLLQEKATSQEVLLALDAGGSFWKTPEGLLLKRLTDTPHLKWAVMDRESANSPVILFQSDGAVVEEFRISSPGAMMAFDIGEFQFKP